MRDSVMSKTGQILQCIKEQPRTTKEIATVIGVKHDYACVVMRRLEDSGRARRVGYGKTTGKRGGTTPYLWGAV